MTTPAEGPSFADPVALATEHYVTRGIPPVPGVIKSRDEDFLVDEQPLYQPSGEGEHIYMLVEKRGMSTTEMTRAIARHFGVHERAVGYAGMKDKNAITRQVISVHTPGKTDADFPMLEHDRLSILWTDLHTNKLRVGHLRGNRFSIRLRDTDPMRIIEAKRVLDTLAAKGVPNYYGEQRFGARLNNHELGRLLLTRRYQELLDGFLGPDALAERHGDEAMRERYAGSDYEGALRASHHYLRNEREALRALADGANAEDAVFSIPRVQLRFWVSAFQSVLLNRAVADRVAEGSFAEVREGDLAMNPAGGRPFLVDRTAALDPETVRRVERFELTATGPMFGSQMPAPAGDTAQYEAALLAASGVRTEEIAEFDEDQGGARGARRAIRVPLTDHEIESGVDEHGGYIRVAFELPPGSYATTVVREITKEHPDEETARARAASAGDHA